MERQTDTIRLLPDGVINKIAAGEVVERPASVVKELVENSLDSGAGLIEIKIKNAGIDSIIVSDNGKGMSDKDLHMSIRRHATSKLRDFNDLFELETFGFRGEAVPSIASVSKMKLVSKTEDDDVAHYIYIEGNEIKDEGIASRARGTDIIVEDLFFNVPARKKFLKTPATETAHIQDIITKFSLIHPSVHFRFISDGRKLIDYPPQTELLDRIQMVLKRRARGRLHEFEHVPAEGIRINLFLTPPEMNLSDSNGVFLFVNKRPVKDKVLLKALTGAYGNLLDKGRYPIAVLYMEISPSMVDVNVHPQKTEVRFRNTRMVAGAVRNTVSEALASAPWAPGGVRGTGTERFAGSYVLKSETDESSADEAIREYRNHRQRILDAVKKSTSSKDVSNIAPVSGTKHSAPVFKSPQKSFSSSSHSFANEKSFSTGRVTGKYVLKPDVNPPLKTENMEFDSGNSELEPVGRIKARYLGVHNDLFLFFSIPEGVMVMDMHAAHERIRYLSVLNEFHENGVTSQILMFPQTVTLDVTKVALVATFKDELAKLGLELDVFGQDSVIVRSVPSVLNNPDLEALLQDLLSELESGGSGIDLSGKIDSIAATMACHSAVRKGHKITESEAVKLLEDLQKAESGGHCPHGRPVSFILTDSELIKRFDRT